MTNKIEEQNNNNNNRGKELEQNYYKLCKVWSLRVYFHPTQSYNQWNGVDEQPSSIRYGSPQKLVYMMILVCWAADILAQMVEDATEVVGRLLCTKGRKRRLDCFVSKKEMLKRVVRNELLENSHWNFLK